MGLNWATSVPSAIPHRHTHRGYVLQPVGLFRCHPNNSPPHNPSLTDIPVPVGGGVALAYKPPAHVFQHPIERPVRLSGSPDSVATQRVAGPSQRLSDRRETPLCDRPTVSVAQTRWGNPPGVLPGVRFATREPAAVIQTVIHAPLFCTFSGVRIWQKSGETQW